jgi:GTP-binding protein
MTRKESPVSRTPKAARAVAVNSPLGRSVRLELPAHTAGERPRGLPLPAVVVLGRSNVGKSSLLNAVLSTKVARVSQTPGRTQALHWYRVDDAFHVIDCPGYGWAKTARESRERFAGLIEELLTGDRGPDLALLLVDGRLEPQASDRSMALFLRTAGVPTVVAATKWDAVKPSQRVRQLRALAAEFEDSERPLLPVSSETGENLPTLGRLLKDRLTGRTREGAAPAAPQGPSQKES